MADVSVIGCGSMGSALARAFIGAGHHTTVWNRTAEKTHPLVEAGGMVAATISDAVQNSPVIVICVADYPATYRLLGTPDVSASLRGRTLIQFSTGAPEEAREAQRWASGLGAAYLDGAILAFPKQIGRPATTIFFSGDEAAWSSCALLVQCLAGKPVFVGADAGGAEAIDLAILSNFLCAVAGASHAASICEAEGVDMVHVMSVLPEGSDAGYIMGTIKAGRFANPGATLETWHNGAIQKLVRQAQSLEIATHVPDFIHLLTSSALAAGYGREHIAAISKLMRKN
jgi:3-hydroxyisobutyrate dehydrogenase-like beta-hydroxyacid dehydrogenase